MSDYIFINVIMLLTLNNSAVLCSLITMEIKMWKKKKRAKLKENRELWGAHNAKDIYPCMFLKSKYGAIVFIILHISCNTLDLLKMRNITHILPSLTWGIFSHAIRLDQPRERKDICRWTIDKAIFTVLLLVE